MARPATDPPRSFPASALAVAVGLAGLGVASAALAQTDAERPVGGALRIDATVDLDGRLDEPFWAQVEPATGFVQREPNPGAPASERTEVRIAYDEADLYIGVRAYDSRPQAIIAREMNRDGSGGGGFGGGSGALGDDDSVIIVLDTFLDGRNAFVFETNPLGARADGLIEGEGRTSREWDGVWNVAARIDEDGWTAELAIPFSTLRLDPSSDTWGLNVQRLLRRRNEESLWAPVGLDASINRISLAGRLTGLAGLEKSLNLRVKPYVTGSTVRDFELSSGPGTDLSGGLDLLRWGVTDNVTLDVTANTDFAQVEADDQQINLTRFSLFFPEKREFFLENSGIFDFGTGGGRGGPLARIFFSRRIGLDEEAEEEVPILAGARLTGRTDNWSFGLLDAQTDSLDPTDPEVPDVPATNWGVARIKRNLGDRSTIGAIYTSRYAGAGDWNRVMGLDADINPGRRLNFNGFLSRSTDSEEPSGWAGGAGFAWRGSVWEASADFNSIDDQFDPELGFLRREGIRRYNYRVQFEPRPENALGVRNLSFEHRAEIITSSDGRLESVDSNLRFFGFTMDSGDRVTFSGGYDFERLDEPFEIHDGVFIEPGRYWFADVGLFVDTAGDRPISVFAFWTYGQFYDGTRLNGRSSLTLRTSRFLALETQWNYNKVSLSAGDFTTTLLQQRVRVALSPNLFWNTFVQYNNADDLLSVNSRFNWIYKPGADVFLVFNQDWDTAGDEPINRALILKFTYLLAL